MGTGDALKRIISESEKPQCDILWSGTIGTVGSSGQYFQDYTCANEDAFYPEYRTFLDVLNLHRVQQALRMIREGATSVASISEKTGFSDYKHFCNVFKRYTGMTPSEFIRMTKS